MANSVAVKLEIALVTYLKTNAPSANNRVYPDVLPQNPVYPAITYQKTFGNVHHDIDVEFLRYQVTAWSERRIDALNTADEIFKALSRYKGYLGDIAVKQISKEPSPGVLFDRDAGADGIYYVPQDFKIIYVR